MFIISGHEECVKCSCGGVFPTKLYLAIALFLCQWRRNVVDSWWFEIHVWIYTSHLIFSVGLALDWNTLMVNCRLAWNLLCFFTGAYKMEEEVGLGRLFIFAFCFHSAALFVCDHKIVFVLYDQKKLYCIADFVLSYNV